MDFCKLENGDLLISAITVQDQAIIDKIFEALILYEATLPVFEAEEPELKPEHSGHYKADHNDGGDQFQ